MVHAPPIRCIQLHAADLTAMRGLLHMYGEAFEDASTYTTHRRTTATSSGCSRWIMLSRLPPSRTKASSAG